MTMKANKVLFLSISVYLLFVVFGVVVCVFGQVHIKTSWRLNCGGNFYKDTAGNFWENDDSYSISGISSINGDVHVDGTTENILYQSERNGVFTYTIPIEESGWFDMTFYFAEVDPKLEIGDRVFDVNIEGIVEIDRLDILETAGFKKSYEITKSVQVCAPAIEITFLKASGLRPPKVNAIYIRPSKNINIDLDLKPNRELNCDHEVFTKDTVNYHLRQTSPTAPVYAKYDYSEVLTKNLLFYEVQRAGKLKDGAVRRVAWRRNTHLDMTNVAGADLSGGYYESANMVKYQFPAAFAFTMIAWSVVEFLPAFQNTGELYYALDALKWQMDFVINAHISKFEFWAQVGNSDPDFGFCGPPEEYYPTGRKTAKLTTTNKGTELLCEHAAGLAASSIAFKSSNPTYSATLLQHARDLYEFGTVYNGSFAKSLPDLQNMYPTKSYEDEIAWAAAWLYRATGEISYLNDAKKWHNLCCSGYGGTALNWGEKDPAVQVLMAKLTGEQIYMSLAESYLNSWMPGPARTVTMTTKGLSVVLAWGSLRYAANTAFLALVYADYVRTTDLNDPQTPQFVQGTKAAKMFNYAVSQYNYMLGDTGFSYVVGFSSNYPKKLYHLSSFKSTIDNPWRGGSTYCNNFNSGSGPNNAFIPYGALTGGPTTGTDTYNDAHDYFYAEPTIDYPAGLLGGMARLTSYYNLPPFCGVLDLGWTHSNATSLGWSPRGLKNETSNVCSPDYSLPITSGIERGQCRTFYDFDTSAEGFSMNPNNTDGAETYLKQENKQLTLKWIKTSTKLVASIGRDMSNGVSGLDFHSMNGFTIKINSTMTDAIVSFAILYGPSYQYISFPGVYKGFGSSTVSLYFGSQSSYLSDVRSLYILINPISFGYGEATIDDISFCIYTTTAPLTTSPLSTAGLTTGKMPTSTSSASSSGKPPGSTSTGTGTGNGSGSGTLGGDDSNSDVVKSSSILLSIHQRLSISLSLSIFVFVYYFY